MIAAVILGIGSPHGDDRAGWAAAQACLRADWLGALDDAVRVECLDRPGPALLERMKGVDCVVLIDAMRSGAPPGTVHRLDPQHLPVTPSASTHGFGVAHAIALGRELGALPREIVVFAIEAQRDGGDRLSAPVEGAIAPLVQQIGAWIAARSRAPRGRPVQRSRLRGNSSSILSW